MNNLVRIISLTFIALLLYPEAATIHSAGNVFYTEKIVFQPPRPKNQKPIDESEFDCLAKNIYFEAAVESTAGKLAVALVTHNRVVSNKFPNTYCEVIQQGKKDSKGNFIRHKCAFSWMCDGKPDNPWKGIMWKESQRIAKIVYTDPSSIPDITDGSTHYHANYVDPYWAKSHVRTVRIDRHIFYR